MRRTLTATIGLGALLLQTALSALAFEVPVARAAGSMRCEVVSVGAFPEDNRAEVLYRIYGDTDIPQPNTPELRVYVGGEKKWSKEIAGLAWIDAKDKHQDVRAILSSMGKGSEHKLRIDLVSYQGALVCQHYATVDMTKPLGDFGGCSVDDVGVNPEKGTAQVVYTMYGIDDTDWADSFDPDLTITVDGKELVDKDVDLRTLHATKKRTERYTVTGLTEKKQYNLEIVLRENDYPGFPDDIICKHTAVADMTKEASNIGTCKILRVAKHRDTLSAEFLYEIYGIDDTQWAHTLDPILSITVNGKPFMTETLSGFAALDSDLKKTRAYDVKGLQVEGVNRVEFKVISVPFVFNPMPPVPGTPGPGPTTIETSEDICVDSVDIDLSKSGNDGPIQMDPPLKEGNHAPYTWLSAECLNLASGASNGGVPSIKAVTCVIKDTIRLLLNLAGFVSTALVVVGGFRMLSATTDDARKSGKNIVTYALIGLIVVLCSFLAVQLLFGGGIL